MSEDYLVYKLTRSDGLVYIGSTTKKSYKNRMRSHKASKRMKGYTFTHEIVATCSNYEDNLIIEEDMIGKYDSYKNGLNLTFDGTGNNYSKNFTTKGFKYSKESREKMSKAAKGRIPWNKGKKNCFSKETIERFSKVRKGVPGRPQKLTMEKVVAIKKLYSSKPDIDNVGVIQRNGKPLSYDQAFSKWQCKTYDVSEVTIRNIIQNKSWKHAKI